MFYKTTILTSETSERTALDTDRPLDLSGCAITLDLYEAAAEEEAEARRTLDALEFADA